MSSRERPSKRWAERERPDDEGRTSGSSFDPLTAPLASEREGEEAVVDEGSSLHRGSLGVRPRPAPDDYATKPVPAASRRAAGRRPFRRVKSTVRHIDPLSVLKLSLFFYSCLLVLWLFFVAFLFWLVGAAGLFEKYDEFRADLVIWEHANITFFVVEKWALIIGVVFVVVGSVLNAFLAFLYNIASDTVGGLELTFLDRE